MTELTRPQPLKSALITIDLQNDFVLPGAPLENAGALEMMPTVARLVRLFRRRGLPIYHVVRLYEADGSNADICRRETIASGKTSLVPGSEGSQLHEAIRPEGSSLDHELLLSGTPQAFSENEFALYKPRWSAFFKTDLDEQLRERGVTTCVVTGTWYHNCVRSTLYDASAHDFRTVAVRDAIAGIGDVDVPHLERVCCRVLIADQFAALLAQYTDII